MSLLNGYIRWFNFISIFLVSLLDYLHLYTVGHKKHGMLLLSISLLIINQYSQFFHWHTLQTICNNVIIIYPTTW